MSDLLYVCSPYRGDTKRNKEYARKLTRAAINNGFVPVTVHLYLTEVTDDQNPEERSRGMAAGMKILENCKYILIGNKYGVSDGMKGGIVMGYMDHTLKKTVPYYSTMKRAGAFKQQEPRKRQKRTTLTEYSQNGQKAILKPHVTVNQAAKKLYDYEQTGLSPHEVANLVEQVQNLTRRVKKYESWEE